MNIPEKACHLSIIRLQSDFHWSSNYNYNINQFSVRLLNYSANDFGKYKGVNNVHEICQLTELRAPIYGSLEGYSFVS